MPEKVVRFFDYERRSRDPDAQAEARDPAGATIIILPVVRIERALPRRIPITDHQGGRP
jgi:hypothetical protein